MWPRSRCFSRDDGCRPLLSASALAVALCLLFAPVAQGQVSSDAVIDAGVQYLTDHRAPDGTWPNDSAAANERRIRDTIEVIRTLQLLEQADRLEEPVSTAGVINLFPLLDTEIQPDRVARFSAQILTGSSASTTLTSILEEQNQDGGWGVVPGKESNFLDTVDIVDAVLGHARLSVHPTVLEAAVAYLEGEQVTTQPGSTLGLWRLTDENSPSDVVLTARGSLALHDLATALNRGGRTLAEERAKAYLQSRIDDQELTSTDRAYMLMALAGQLEPAELDPLVAMLASAQRSDGSWGGDPHTTAVVLRAIAAVAPPSQRELPDLTVRSTDVRFMPAGPGAEATLEVVVRNIGVGPATSTGAGTGFKVMVVEGDPRLGHPAVEGRELYTATVDPAVPGGAVLVPGASVVLRVPGFEFYRGQQDIEIGVVVDSENSVREASEANNVTVANVLLGEGRPDLAIRAEDLAVNVTAGGVIFSARVRNLGAPLEPGTTIQVGGVLDDGGGPVSIGALTGGSPDTAPYTLEHGPLSPGDYTFTATLPTGDFDEGNNSASLYFSVAAAPPDLRIDPATLKFYASGTSEEISDPELGELVDVSVRVENIGEGGSASCQLWIAPDDPRSWPAGAPPLPFAAIGELSPDSHADALVPGVRVPFGRLQPDGSRRAVLGLWVDATQANTETDEQNNLLLHEISFPAAASLPDLAVVPGSVTFSHLDLDANPTVRLGLALCNLGGEATTATTVRFQYRLEPIGGGSGDLIAIGSIPVQELLPGQSIDIWLPWHPPANDPLRVLATVEYTASEVSAANNSIESDQVSFQSSEFELALTPSPGEVGGVYYARSPEVLANGGLTISMTPVGPGVVEGTSYEVRGFYRPASSEAYSPLSITGGAQGVYTISWETLALLAPGEYEIRGELWFHDHALPVRDPGRTRLLDTLTVNFDVGPTILTNVVTPFVSPDRLEVRVMDYQTDPTSLEVDELEELTATLSGLRNVPASYELMCTVVQYRAGEDPTTVYTSASAEAIILSPGTQGETKVLMRPVLMLPADEVRGHYVVEVTATLQSTGLDPFAAPVVRGRTSFDIEDTGSLRLLGKVVEPDVVPPRDGERVRVKILIGRGEP